MSVPQSQLWTPEVEPFAQLLESVGHTILSQQSCDGVGALAVFFVVGSSELNTPRSYLTQSSFLWAVEGC